MARINYLSPKYKPTTYETPTYTPPVQTYTPPKTTTSSNTATLELQKKLKASGFDPGPLDGIMGPLTQAAQSKYNKAQQMQTALSKTTPTPTPTPTLQNTYDPQTGMAVIGGQTYEKGTFEDGQFKGVGGATPIIDNTPIKENPGLSIQYPTYDPTSYVNYMQEAQMKRLAAMLPQISAAYEKSRESINSAIPQVGQNAQAALNENEAMYAKGKQDLYAALEQAGTYRGGANPEGIVRLNAARMGNVGNINTQKTSQLEELRRALAAIDTEEQGAILSAQAGSEADLYSALAEAQQFGANYGLDLYKTQLGQSNFQQQLDLDKKYQELDYLLKSNDQKWNQSTDNPSNKLAILQAEEQALRNTYLPQQYQAELDKAKQDFETGKITMEQMRAEIKRIQAETSYTYQQTKNLKSGLTASGGIPSGQTQAEQSTKVAAITQSLDRLSGYEAYYELLNNSGDYIGDIGSTEYNRLLGIYKNKAGLR